MFRYVLMCLMAVAACITMPSCGSQEIDMTATCDVTKGKGYIVKWDIYPKIDGRIKVYISENPNVFDLSKPVAEADVNKNYVKIASPDFKRRFYFKVVLNNKYCRVIGTRGANIRSAYTFRDIGGFRNEDNKFTKWGMLYRSGRLDTLNNTDKERFYNLGIKTIIDLSNDSSNFHKSYGLDVKNTICLVMNNFDNEKLKERIYDGEFRKGDAKIFMQDFFISLMEGDACNKYATIFDVLSDESNYPVVITSRYGKGYCDFASALLLSALGVPKELILEDYTWANQYFNFDGVKARISNMANNTQESIIRIIENDRSDLICMFNAIDRKFGSMENFLSNQIDIDSKKNNTLRKILLTEE